MGEREVGREGKITGNRHYSTAFSYDRAEAEMLGGQRGLSPPLF